LLKKNGLSNKKIALVKKATKQAILYFVILSVYLQAIFTQLG